MDTPSPRSITVYCGASSGVSQDYRDSATALGRAIAGRGATLVYGGGSRGLMGIVADAALAAGGHVVGVIPHDMVDRELAHQGLSDLIRVADMGERKREMMMRGEAFVALPGGVGTLEEIIEVMSWAQLAIHRKPFGLVNTRGYYGPLLACFDHMVAEGFLPAETRRLMRCEADPATLLDRLAEPVPAVDRWR